MVDSRRNRGHEPNSQPSPRNDVFARRAVDGSTTKRPTAFRSTWAETVTGIHKFAYEALLKHLGFRTRFASWITSSSWPSPARRCCNGSTSILGNCRQAGSRRAGKVASSRRITATGDCGTIWRDEFGIGWSMPDDHAVLHGPALASVGRGDTADIERLPCPKGDDPSRFAGLRERVLTLKRNETPYAVVSRICRGSVRVLLVSARPGAVVVATSMGEPDFARLCWIKR